MGREKQQEMSSGIQFKALEHKSQHIVPVFKLEVTQQGLQILEKPAARAQSLANSPVLIIHQVQNSVKAEL